MTLSIPTIAISMGDPAGVGPELVLQAAANPEIQTICRPIIFGDLSVLKSVASKLNLEVPQIQFQAHEWLNSNAAVSDANLNSAVLDFDSISTCEFEPGVTNATTGDASFKYFDAAISAAKQKQVDAIVTGPINKEAINSAGHQFAGHTEILADRFGIDDVCMMLTSQDITCSIVTTHIGYGDVLQKLSTEKIYTTLVYTHDALVRIRGRAVKLCCCGLNPHAGEHGLFGNNEEEILIEPALEKARSNGIDICGPLPADTAFRKTQRDFTDGYICMYHDQGLIPLKALAFDDAVNISLGLPIVRTSVDHGTACDIAWQGIANVSSLLEAIKLAVKLAR